MNLIFYMVRTEKPGAHKGSGYNEKKKTTSGSCRRWFLSCTDLDAAAGGEGRRNVKQVQHPQKRLLEFSSRGIFWGES